MFGGSSSNPVFPVAVDDGQFNYDAVASTQLQLFGNIPAACNVDPANYAGINSIAALSRLNKRNREMEEIGRQHKVQLSYNFFQDEPDQSRSIPNPNAVSTGLRLFYDDDEHNSSVTSASGTRPSFPVLTSLGINLRSEIDRQKEEFEHYIRIQEEQIAKGVKEMKRRHMATLVSAMEKGVERKLQEKELVLENMNRKNKELVEHIKQVAMEVQSWQYRARYSESVVNALQSSLKQAIAEGADQGKEGCGDSDVDDAASNYHPNPRLTLGGLPLAGAAGNKGSSSEQTACKSCKSKEICMLLIPCRHLCLCEDCAGFIDLCPICQSAKSSSVQVYMP